MGDFKETVFDVSKLDDHQLGCLEFVLSSPAYEDVFEPYLKSVRNSMNMRLLDRSKERKDDTPDDFLAGGVVVIDGLLTFFKKIIEEVRMERVDAAVNRLTPDQRYEADRRAGKHVPILGANEPMEPAGPRPYDPAEDF